MCVLSEVLSEVLSGVLRGVLCGVLCGVLREDLHLPLGLGRQRVEHVEKLVEVQVARAWLGLGLGLGSSKQVTRACDRAAVSGGVARVARGEAAQPLL